jgi:hypothetical protein
MHVNLIVYKKFDLSVYVECSNIFRSKKIIPIAFSEKSAVRKSNAIEQKEDLLETPPVPEKRGLEVRENKSI